MKYANDKSIFILILAVDPSGKFLRRKKRID